MRADNKSTTQKKTTARGRGKSVVLLFSAMLSLLFVGSPAQAADVYKVTLSRTGTMGLTTDCNSEGYFLAHWEQKYLQANGSDVDANGDLGPELLARVGSDVGWMRKYDAGRGLSGVFDGCFGETAAPAKFYIFFEGRGNKSTVRFTWHFDYYLATGVREHFTLHSEKIPFAAWTGGNLSGTVKGTFDLKYYLKEGKTIVSSYESLAGGQGRQFEFVLTVEKVQ
ncbi:MAG: hypothetical protein ACRDGN_13890 [bacterium]